MNSQAEDEATLFADAVQATDEPRPAGCWAPKGTRVAIAQTRGRDRLNIHGAIDLETGKTKMLEVLTVNAESTIALLMAIMIMYPAKRLIHVFLDNARYHHAEMVEEWLARPECRIKLHFIPTYCPHLDPIERLWGLMHKNVTHNRCYAKFNDFCNAVLGFLRDEAPKNWRTYCDSVSDNFRIINPADFRVLKAEGYVIERPAVVLSSCQSPAPMPNSATGTARMRRSFMIRRTGAERKDHCS